MIDFQSHLLSDSEKKNNLSFLTASDMIDRIINLKLTTANYIDGKGEIKHDEYVIRSDWELCYKNTGKMATGEASYLELKDCYIRRYVHKPSIKVQYKQIASGTAIEIDIFVHNFTMLSADGRSLMAFNAMSYPLAQVEVQMGYIGQFNHKPTTLAEYFDFSHKLNVDTLTVDVSRGYVQTDSLPPDSVLHIHGYVGTCYIPPLIQLQGKEIKKTVYEDIKNPKLKYNDYFKDYVYWNITKRFVRKAVNSGAIVLDEKTGTMNDLEAEKYGVKVFASSELLKASKEAEKAFTAVSKSGEKIVKTVTSHYSDSVVQAMNILRDELGLDIGFKALLDGNYVAFLAEETGDSQKLAETLRLYKYEDKDLLEAGSVVDTIYHNILPAVSNITTDRLCTIVCPFFYFLNPFDMIKFKSRYALGGIVSYLANFSVVESKFYALYMTVSFATVENINECTIVCTGSKENKGA